ncbi:DsbE family thiol:disulfide interchange protein [Pikeienuella sp. HZG-20]|uniref:DsbE family thiol:disulfide interchange protein n=1 Tax=Paludibacillus litoralis TaxID=3133267 RepID=UPI0030EE7FB3
MTDERKPQSRVMRFLPVVGFAVIAAVFWFGLSRDNASDLPSTLIDKPAPQTNLPPLYEGRPGIEAAALADGQVKLVNIWASWCGPCRVEHPSLMGLAAEGVDIRGFNYKDAPAQAKAFLAGLGDPYTALGADESGRAAIEWGVYGVPETFVINGDGRIVYKHIGPIQNDDIEKRIMPAIKAAGG